MLHAGTTDGCASFLATGASEVGDGVTALGSTLVLKLACAAPINSSTYGIYSHRVLGFWLAGGASNSGGAVIRSLFAEFFWPLMGVAFLSMLLPLLLKLAQKLRASPREAS